LLTYVDEGIPNSVCLRTSHDRSNSLDASCRVQLLSHEPHGRCATTLLHKPRTNVLPWYRCDFARVQLLGSTIHFFHPGLGRVIVVVLVEAAGEDTGQRGLGALVEIERYALNVFWHFGHETVTAMSASGKTLAHFRRVRRGRPWLEAF